MYNTSEHYNIAAAQPIQEHRITGTIGTSGMTFDNSNIIEGSFQITNQCTDTNALVFGSCYIGELSCEFTGLEYSTSNPNGIQFSEWIGLAIEPTFGIYFEDDNQWQSVPLGKYTIKEAVHTENGVQITAYDDMSKFDVEIPDANLSYLLGLKTDNLYAFASYVCSQCGVFLGMTRQEFDALPNATSTTANIQIYGKTSDGKEFANDILTYRDLMYWIGQTMCSFCTCTRSGDVIFKKFPKTNSPDDVIGVSDRLEGMTLADYVTHFTGIYVTDLDTNNEVYYGYDAAALEEEINEVTSELSQVESDLIELELEYQQGQITEQEYKAQKKVLTSKKKSLEKRLNWLEKAYDSASYAKASSIELGPNPFLMYGGKRSAMSTHRRKVLKNALALSYTPFSMDIQCGWHYDLGDIIQISGGRFNSSNDCFGCVMGYTFNLHGVCTLEGFGENPALAKVKSKASKQANTANTNAINSKEITSGTDDPEGGKDNDIYIKYATHVTKTPKITVENTGEFVAGTNGVEAPANNFKITDFEWDDQVGGYHIKASGNYCYGPGNWHAWDCIIKGLFTAPGNYRFECDAKWTAQGVSSWTWDTVPRMTTWTHSDSVDRDVPVDMVHFGDSNTDDQFHHYVGNTFSIRQVDFDAGDFLFWFGPGMPVKASSDLPYIEVEITGLKVVYIDPNTGQPDPDGGVNTNTEKYIDHVYVKTEDESGNKIWKEIEYVAGADTSSHSGLSLNYKRWLSLTPEVMRAWFKADPPQAEQTFNRYCMRYTGEPDKTVSLAYNAATAWTNGSVKVTKEHVYTVKSSGAYESGTVQQIAYKIEGLTSGKKYWFNFWAKFSGAEFGEDFDKGLGLVWSTTNSINTDDWTGDPHTYNDTTKYLSMYRVNAKRYYEAGVTVTASTMYMILTVGDLTDGNDINFTIGDLVIAQEQKKYARSIYLFDVDTETWVKYKPFGMSDDDGESDISYLNELNDVEINNAQNGEVLTYQNGSWVNAAAGGIQYVEISRANYNNLTPEQKADATKIYLVED